MTIFAVAVCFIVLAFIFTQNKAQNTAAAANQHEAISQDLINKSIQTLTAMVTDQNAQTFGLTSKDQVTALKAGKQYNVYMIGLNDIKKYKTGQDVAAIVKPLPVIEVSLVDDSGKIRSAIEFVKKSGHWGASAFGLSPEMVSVSTVQSLRPDTSKTNISMIRIPALRVNFISTTSTTGLNFTVLENNESLGFRQGETIAAKNAILKLVQTANVYNGLPQ